MKKFMLVAFLALFATLAIFIMAFELVNSDRAIKFVMAWLLSTATAGVLCAIAGRKLGSYRTGVDSIFLSWVCVFATIFVSGMLKAESTLPEGISTIICVSPVLMTILLFAWEAQHDMKKLDKQLNVSYQRQALIYVVEFIAITCSMATYYSNKMLPLVIAGLFIPMMVAAVAFTEWRDKKKTQAGDQLIANSAS